MDPYRRVLREDSGIGSITFRQDADCVGWKLVSVPRQRFPILDMALVEKRGRHHGIVTSSRRNRGGGRVPGEAVLGPQ
ncbi:hypothetical protein AMELA_G00095260 [Ameiurus melas]|uniref:Uncharacterized protein n=1 Tax=Ameiurus melas TaxID=219545 RepID=A0A7J6AZ78_AMEME|nr:hypothetical protein AMELA_G00095260 [Ameiurus melas]